MAGNYKKKHSRKFPVTEGHESLVGKDPLK